MKRIKCPNTTLFRTGLTAIFLLFSLTAVQGSLLEGEDIEEKVANALDDFATEFELPDLSEFEDLKQTATGSDHPGSFERAQELFIDIATRRNGMLEAMALMRQENEGNRFAVTGIRPVDISDHQGHPHDFQPVLSWETILMKLTLLPKALDSLGDNLENAFEEHKRLKLIGLKRDYGLLAVRARKVTGDFEGINGLYDKPEVLEPEDVSEDGLETLKQKISGFEEAVAGYDIALVQAKKWQKTFDLYQKQYVSLTAKQEQLGRDFNLLREANDQNPHLKAVDGLPEIADEGNLVTIKETLEEIIEAQRLLAEDLALAKKWKPEVIDDL
ncbi:MAG: hypothetical protein GW748_04245 [Alphaproteobacteria bacterium]|nr:hypothetical protein [Alphaproteobacteria bacterium]NCQ66934.1 hypothetical protein [Alphaproteobacteria bacterium]NCT07501.1 hypothetical protein [Alphaproteobacteria bacterium]